MTHEQKHQQDNEKFMPKRFIAYCWDEDSLDDPKMDEFVEISYQTLEDVVAYLNQFHDTKYSVQGYVDGIAAELDIAFDGGKSSLRIEVPVHLYAHRIEGALTMLDKPMPYTFDTEAASHGCREGEKLFKTVAA